MLVHQRVNQIHIDPFTTSRQTPISWNIYIYISPNDFTAPDRLILPPQYGFH